MGTRKIVATEDNKAIARYVAQAFGGPPHAFEYGHDTLDLTVGIIQCDDRPVKGVTAYSTVKLSDYPMLDNGKEFATRLELCAAFESSYAIAPNILATAAFIVMRTQRLCYPGAVIEHVVREYDQNSDLPHLYMSSPFLWEESLRSLVLPSLKTVTWLLAMPISQSELDYLCTHDAESLERVFEMKRVDMFDPHRKPAL